MRCFLLGFNEASSPDTFNDVSLWNLKVEALHVVPRLVLVRERVRLGLTRLLVSE